MRKIKETVLFKMEKRNASYQKKKEEENILCRK